MIRFAIALCALSWTTASEATSLRNHGGYSLCATLPGNSPDGTTISSQITYTASIAASGVMTVTTQPTGALAIGQKVRDTASTVSYGTAITGQTSGPAGGIGTYTTTPTGQTIASTTMQSNNTTGSIKTIYGTWSFGDYYADRGPLFEPDLYPVLNGTPIEDTSGIEGAPITARELKVVNCGNLAALTLSAVYNGWTSNRWLSESDLSNPIWDPLPPNQVTPPFTLSTDGISITGGTGSLTSADGVWSFGAAQSGGTGNLVLLNGASVNHRYADQIEIHSHGNVWVHDVTLGGSAQWDIWQRHVLWLFFQVAGGSVVFGAPPPSAAIIPVGLVITPPTPNPLEYNGTLSPSAALGTVIGTMTLNLSDGTTGTCGAAGVVCNIGATNASPPLAYASLSGNNIVMAITPISDCGHGFSHALPLSYTLNSVTVYKLFDVSPVGC